jgi:SAM-dependent methyltransferase
MTTMAAACQAAEAEEAPMRFDGSHYANGINGDFLADRSAEELILKFAGGSCGACCGGGGKFEDAEQRDIAAAVPAIMHLLTSTLALPPDGTVIDVGAGTGLLLRPLAEALPRGQVVASELSPDFRAWMAARVEVEGIASHVRVVEATTHDPLPAEDPCFSSSSSDGSSGGSALVALLVDVYHHLEFPRTVCRKLRAALHPTEGRLVVLDFHRDPSKVKSKPPEWVWGHLRAGQEVFREEILSAGWVLESEPLIPELKENYCMVFRPATPDELRSPGAGWAMAHHVVPPTRAAPEPEPEPAQKPAAAERPEANQRTES